MVSQGYPDIHPTPARAAGGLSDCLFLPSDCTHDEDRVLGG